MRRFRSAVLEQVPGLDSQGPAFGRGVAVEMEVKFHCKRPNSDFVGNVRGAGRLRSWLPRVRPIRPDIDNLAKFVLDGLNGLVYHDDRQVVRLVATKLLDCEGDCAGRTSIVVSRFDPVVL